MGGGGGFAKGTLAVTPGQTIYVNIGEGGKTIHIQPNHSWWWCKVVQRSYGSPGGGATLILLVHQVGDLQNLITQGGQYPNQQPQAYLVDGGGGGDGACGSRWWMVVV